MTPLSPLVSQCGTLLLAKSVLCSDSFTSYLMSFLCSEAPIQDTSLHLAIVSPEAPLGSDSSLDFVFDNPDSFEERRSNILFQVLFKRIYFYFHIPGTRWMIRIEQEIMYEGFRLCWSLMMNNSIVARDRQDVVGVHSHFRVHTAERSQAGLISWLKSQVYHWVY